MNTEDVWRRVISEALMPPPTQPLRGTGFRAAVKLAAERSGTTFPPPDDPSLRFVQLLQRYPDIVTIIRRPGQDVLVIPTGRDDLLAAAGSGSISVRRDFFEAFTQFRAGQAAVYDRELDRVVWRPEDAPLGRQSMVQIPRVNAESEIQLRKEFVQALPDESLRRTLDSVLEGPSPFPMFGEAIRENRLQREWHVYRTERLTQRIQEWANQSDVSWRDAWFTTSRASARANLPLSINPSLSAEGFGELLSRLEPADLQRISVPLDLVLKALRGAGER